MPTKVLVFESDPAFAGELRNELGKLGCATTVVDDGNVGLQQAATDRPDLVLLSIELPRMNGFSVCNKLKKDANLKDVPLIIMSSESSDETFEQHKKLRTRAEDYVHKPIAFGELLQHIQAFVRLESMRPPDGDSSSIVIDDDIEIGSTDYMMEDDGTQIAQRPPIGMPQVTQRGMETVDADVDAFADAAFGRLTGSEPPGAGSVVPEARPINNGTSDSVTVQVSVPARRASTAPAPRAASVRPPSGVDIAEYEKIREELVRTRARATTLETELGEARNDIEKWRLEAAEVDRLNRELEELKAKLATGAPKTGGISSREFLDLREALNKKDKEILSLKEAQSRKDKEHVESQDKMLALERAKSDLDEKTLALEREAAETRDRVEALTADKELAKKAADDFKGRLEKSRAEGEARDRQLSEAKAKQAEEIAASAARLADAKTDFEQTLASERSDHVLALEEAEARRKADLEQANRDREAAVAEAREQADRERQEALSAQGAQLKQEHDGKMAALHRAGQQELEKVRGEAERAARDAGQRHEETLATAQREAEGAAAEARSTHEAELARVRAESEKKAGDALESLRGEHAEKVTALENDRDSRLAALESRLAREVSEANDKLAKADMDLSATRGELAELREAKETGDAAHEAALADVRGRLSEVTSARDALDKKASAATDHVAALEAELAAFRQELAETKQRLAGESARADKAQAELADTSQRLGGESARADRAQAKWEADRQSLERAKDAMAVALAQIEETEGRPLG